MKETFLGQKNKEFINKIKEINPHYFDELKRGQSPEYFVLSCSDSRVSPSVITQMPLGKMFIHRNIANQVDINDESFSAGLYYALKHLKVKKIIIEGHTDCGGVKAVCTANNEEHLKIWLQTVKEGLPASEELERYSEEELSRLNVISQVKRLKDHPVYKEYGEDVEIIGCLFHVESGELEWLELDINKTKKEMA